MKNKAYKNIASIGVWVILSIGLLLVLVMINSWQKTVRCSDMKIEIEYETDDKIIQYSDIRDLIYTHCGMIRGREFSEMNASEIEALLKSQPYIKDPQVYSTLDGMVKVSMKQRRPLVRIFDETGKSWYLDAEGYFLPVNHARPQHLAVVSGRIPELSIYQQSLMEINPTQNVSQEVELMISLFRLAQTIDKDEFMRAFVDQIYVNEKREFELIPVIGEHIVIFGTTDRLEEKIFNLKAFYHKASRKYGLEQYSSINVKYKNQVVCKKNKVWDIQMK